MRAWEAESKSRDGESKEEKRKQQEKEKGWSKKKGTGNMGENSTGVPHDASCI